jgi:antitoxin ParD1/3/4
MATMSVILPRDIIDFVDEAVASGSYSSSSEVVRDALLLLQQDKALAGSKLAGLQDEIMVGIEDVQAGRFSEMTIDDIVDEVLPATR